MVTAIKPLIDMKPPARESKALAAIGYDAPSQTLAVRFANSDIVHHYSGVPPEEVDALHAADSIGSHFHKRIRNNTSYVHSVPTDDGD
jgi:hypothetical protein